MELSDATLKTVQQLLVASLSPDNFLRKQAEDQLKQLEGKQNYLILLLQLISKCEDFTICLSAATLFKNISIRRFSDDSTTAVQPNERSLIYTEIVNLMCSKPDKIRATLAEAISIVVESDYPDSWNIIFPNLIKNLQVQDINKFLGVFETSHAICRQFRDVAIDNSNVVKLKIALDYIAEPLLQIYTLITEQLAHINGNVEQTKQIYYLVKIMTKLYYDLNYICLPEYFEDHLKEWMTLFKLYLGIDFTTSIYIYFMLIDQNKTQLIELQETIIDSIILMSEKNQEEFEPYYTDFSKIICGLCMKVNEDEVYDKLSISCMNYLGSIITKEQYYKIFEGETLVLLLNNIIYQNMKFRISDEENFEMNPIEYIRRDAEGSDSYTRRRSARELIQNTLKYYSNEVFANAIEYLNKMKQNYIVNRVENWSNKDICINLIIALCGKGYTYKFGVMEVNDKITSLIDLNRFYNDEIKTELLNYNSSLSLQDAIIKADSMKFCMIFRNQFNKTIMIEIMQMLINYINSDISVLRMYSGICIERFLCVKDTEVINGINKNKIRIKDEDIRIFIGKLVESLFGVISKIEDEFIMKAIMRVVYISLSDVKGYLEIILKELTNVLERICKNPQNPSFNHYLFETIALLIKCLCNNNMSIINGFEKCLFPSFNIILRDKITEFTPYVYQILGELLECYGNNNNNINEIYKELYNKMMIPSEWDDKGNNPPMIKYIIAYLKVDVNYIINNDLLAATLGIFQRLISIKSRYIYGFELINCIIEKIPLKNIQNYLSEIIKILLFKAQSDKNDIQFRMDAINSICLMIVMYKDVNIVINSIESIQSGLFLMVINQLFIPIIPEFLNEKLIRCLVVGLCLLFNSGKIDDNTIKNGSKNLLNLLLKNNISEMKEIVENEMENNESIEEMEYNSNYSRLIYAKIDESILFPDLPDTTKIFSNFISSLIMQNKYEADTEVKEYLNKYPPN